MDNNFFNKIIYSACNEDSESERKMLNITSEDVVLCITGSGARTLDLVIDCPKSIISVDFNKAQNYLLELKIAAYKELNYKEFLQFLGLDQSENRVELFNKTLPLLSDAAKEFWINNIKLIKNGILYSGKWETFLQLIIRFIPFKKKSINQLMKAPDISTQKKAWDKKFNTWHTNLFLKIICNRLLWVYLVKEPGASLIDRNFKIYTYLKKRLDFMANNFYMKQNHFANLIFYGRYMKGCDLPIHLKEENFEIIKRNVYKIQIITDSLQNVLKTNLIKEVTKFSLSDFSSYSDSKLYTEIWLLISTHANPNCKIAERQFLVKRSPEYISDFIKRDFALEENLHDTDTSFIYSFVSARIQRGD